MTAAKPINDEEKDPEEGSESVVAAKTHTTSIWITLNILLTIAIVYVNKAIFSSPPFSHCPLAFVAYHFTVTALLLYCLSRPAIAFFTPAKNIPFLSVLPLTLSMCGNVVLLNLSLEYSSIICYQTSRILLTPLTALISVQFYGAKLPLRAVLTFIPVCVGVGFVSYYDLDPRDSESGSATSYAGLIYALSAVVCSSLYMTWILHYRSRFEISSVQLLHHQMGKGAVFLAALSLFTDTFPVWSTVTVYQWSLVLVSGVCACLINLSLFFMVGDIGPVSSTIVGHLKTCLVIGLGWATSKKAVGMESILGVLLAMAGIALYSIAMSGSLSNRAL